MSADRLSIIVPVYNEARYVGEVLEALLDKELPIDREIVVVESNSSDGSREIVRSFADRPGVRVILEDEPRGKGHAVRAGLAEATGTIILIQDADFEYDLDDYEALLEPLLQRHTSFVLGSRSLGLDDWKVRQYADSRIKGFLMNVGADRVRQDLQPSVPAAGHRHQHDVQGVSPRVHRRVHLPRRRLQLRHRAGVQDRAQRIQPARGAR